ncbi:MAG: hypothetical protein AAGE94_14985 [Acidobacteriota bacterium]
MSESTDTPKKPSRRRGPTPVNIRNFSVKCGRCDQYQVIVAFEPAEDGEHNRYIYECDWPPCDEDREASRTVLEVPIDLDEFANRDPNWRGGKIHAGAEPDPEETTRDAAASDEEPSSRLPVLR